MLIEKIFTLAIAWDPSPAATSWNLPLLGRPILWYGVFFALGFFFAYLVFQNLLKGFMRTYRFAREDLHKFTEKLSLYVVIGTILGARLGDVLFYQNPLAYVNDPLGIFRFWEGGLASHGAVAGILSSLWIFCRRIKKKYPMLTWMVVLDLLVIPALLAGGFIRIGNFFNQEILGTPTTLPWGVIFGHPVDGGALVPRHPVQLYEALFYFSFFAVLLFLRKKSPKIFQRGRTSGLFFMATFAFRFLIEYVKSEQSALISQSSWIGMGQLLSLPLFCVGLALFFSEKYRLRPRPVEGE